MIAEDGNKAIYLDKLGLKFVIDTLSPYNFARFSCSLFLSWVICSRSLSRTHLSPIGINDGIQSER